MAASSRAAARAGGAAAAHALLLLAPCFVLGRAGRALADPTVTVFLVLLTFLCAAEVAFASGPLPLHRPLRARRAGSDRLAAWSGAALLGVFWTALVERTGETPGLALDKAAAALFAGSGLLLATAGAALRTLSVRTLGRWFVTELDVHADQPLIRNGPYRFVRHPSETGLLAFSAGACLWLGSGAALAVWMVALLPSVLLRVRAENALLTEAFGDEFRAYAERVPSLVPGFLR